MIAVGVAVEVAVTIAVGVAVAVAVGIGVAVIVGVAVTVMVGVGDMLGVGVFGARAGGAQAVTLRTPAASRPASDATAAGRHLDRRRCLPG